MPLLEVKNLRVNYRVYEGVLKVINGVSQSLQKGEKFGLIGESACGKTTTVLAVMMLLASNSMIAGGEVKYAGGDVLTMKKKKLSDLRRKKMAMVFQDPSAALNPVFTVKQQLYDIIKFSTDTKLSKQETHEAAIKYLKQAALPEPDRSLESYPCMLSGGMKQRVNIAMALVSANELLIADEPGTSLDVTIEDQVMRLLKKIVEEKGISVILITHALGTVKNFVDRIYVMYAGTIVEEGPTKEVFNNPQHPYTQMLIKAVPKLTGGGVPEGILGQVPSYLSPPPGCRFVTRCPYKMDICGSIPPMYGTGTSQKAACFLFDDGHRSK